MQIEAIYEHGRLEFVRPMQFKRQRVRLVVDVPDDEIVGSPDPDNLPPEVFAQAQAMLDKFEAVRDAPLPPDDELPEVKAKHLERMDAYALREQMRNQQGHPD